MTFRLENNQTNIPKENPKRFNVAVKRGPTSPHNGKIPRSPRTKVTGFSEKLFVDHGTKRTPLKNPEVTKPSTYVTSRSKVWGDKGPQPNKKRWI